MVSPRSSTWPSMASKRYTGTTRGSRSVNILNLTACRGRFVRPGVLQVRRPALLDPPKPPDQQRDHPGRRKQGNDQEPEEVDVDVREPVPKRSGEVQLRADQTADLDRADHQRDRHRQGRDREVVEDLA